LVVRTCVVAASALSIGSRPNSDRSNRHETILAIGTRGKGFITGAVPAIDGKDTP